ncbi:uncharacterized protein EI90DRAFT_3014093 [Cantharellus anzutake]|uniref:uncharacterized protein n=1 Tax=Cantharellus anzutake TaxID=1750568 RepID=UPI001906D59E|nr:uncharacterized protein EI90DRAFT_3014093 [Cantharellus anzutake]KAF8336294.1 hypothetical protein EI90DRAFT_3014093 [Cantharellus anzutake]
MDNLQDVRMYLGGSNVPDNEVSDDESDGPIINRTLLAVSQITNIPTHNLHTSPQSSGTGCTMFSTENTTISPNETLTFPPAHAQAKKHAINDLEHIMSFSSSTNSIVSSSPLCSTFKLPEHNCDSRSKTCLELVQENQKMQHKFRKAQVLVERAIDAVDAANAQLALGGMYVSKAQTQLLVWEEAEKSKEDGGHITGTFG